MAGMPKNVIARLQPTKLVKHPNVNDPKIAPMQFIEPIHDICSNVIGPVFSGDSSEERSCNAGATHPMMQPCENMMKFAEGRENHKKYSKSNKASVYFTWEHGIELIPEVVESIYCFHWISLHREFNFA